MYLLMNKIWDPPLAKSQNLIHAMHDMLISECATSIILSCVCAY